MVLEQFDARPYPAAVEALNQQIHTADMENSARELLSARDRSNEGVRTFVERVDYDWGVTRNLKTGKRQGSNKHRTKNRSGHYLQSGAHFSGFYASFSHAVHRAAVAEQNGSVKEAAGAV